MSDSRAVPLPPTSGTPVARVVLFAGVMRLHQHPAIVRLASLIVIALIGVASTPRAQRKDTIYARAETISAGGAAESAPFSLEIARFATDAERDDLVRAVKADGTEGARQFLARRGAVGTLQLGERSLAVKYAFVRGLGDGRLITAITDKPFVFSEAVVPGFKSATAYAVALALVIVPDVGEGTGEFVPAAKVRIDEHAAVVTEAYDPATVVHLTNVTLK